MKETEKIYYKAERVAWASTPLPATLHRGKRNGGKRVMKYDDGERIR